MINHTIDRKRTESIMRIAFTPILSEFAKKHFPEINPEGLKDLIDGVTDMVANSFEDYREDYEAEMLDEVDYQQSLLKEAALDVDMTKELTYENL